MDKYIYDENNGLYTTFSPITIYLRFKARQPAVSFSALLPKLLEWDGIDLTKFSKD